MQQEVKEYSIKLKKIVREAISILLKLEQNKISKMRMAIKK